MPHSLDPFVHHPELRGHIKDSAASFFRDFSVDRLIADFPELETFRDSAHSDATRDAIRARALADHEGDLWVFAYGSLMWDPALEFIEVRRVHAPAHARKLMLYDDEGGRGTKVAPGLMAALDHGSGCDGLVFRLAAAQVETETDILFRREVISPGYIPAFIPVTAADTQLSALTFLADHAEPNMRPDLSWDEQVRLIATGQGVLGTSYDYLRNVVLQLDRLGIEDRHCTQLLRAVDDHMKSNPEAAP